MIRWLWCLVRACGIVVLLLFVLYYPIIVLSVVLYFCARVVSVAALASDHGTRAYYAIIRGKH